MKSSPRVAVFFNLTLCKESAFFQGVIRHAESRGWRILVGEEVACLPHEALNRWDGDGVIGFLRDRDFVTALQRAGIPAVNTSQVGATRGIPSVIPDFVEAGRMVAQYFLERGFRQFAYCGETEFAYRDTKLKGFRQRLSEAGMECLSIPQPSTVPENRTWPQHRAALLRQLRQLPKPVAVWGRRDEFAARVVAACEAGSIRVPEEIAVIGYGDEPLLCPCVRPARSLEAPREGEGWVFLDWKEPVDGGAVAAYKIQRRLRPDGPWSDAGMAIESEITLTNQERGKEWEYRVLAVNKA
ncbi:substrate-binding domain-containing protein, partial [Candidatus Sumerlaeota bacterium]|nr:substrate-binding domain-containing protein [Candidatus Sumerlaeota bacterium]